MTSRLAKPLTPIPPRVWAIAAITGVGALMAMVDSTLVNLAVESIRVDLGSSLSVVQWVVTGYLIALAVSLPASAWLGARFGHGRVWAVSTAVFVAASAVCALAPGMGTLVTARVAQGLAGGLMVPAGQAVIGSVAGRDQLGRLFGVLGMAVALGPAIGPAVGGMLLRVASWRWLFWLNVPIGVAALLAAWRLVPDGICDTARRVDRRGLLLLGVGLPLGLYGATDIGTAGAMPLSVAAVVAGVVLVAVFVANSSRAETPLIDLRLTRDGTFTAATVITGFTGAAMYGGLLVLPLYLRLELRQDSATVGMMLLVMGLGTAGALYVGGAMADRWGAGPVVLAGAGLLLMTTVLFVLPCAMPVPVLLVVLTLRGAGLALAQMPATTTAYATAGPDRIGDATTIVNIVQRVGGAVGAAGVVVILGDTAEGDAYHLVFAVLSGLAVVTGVSAAVLWRTAEASSTG